MNRLRSGAWSGMLATGPMTLALFALQKRMPTRQKSPLPPATITKDITGSGNPDLTMLSHFAYGMGAAVLYSLLTPKAPRHPLVRGLTYGLGVWAASYGGWLPLIRSRASLTRLSVPQNLMMVAAHMVWGLALGASEYAMRSRGERMLKSKRDSKLLPVELMQDLPFSSAEWHS